MHHHPTDLDLLQLIDHEVPAARAAGMLAHLEECTPCRTRHGEIAETLAEATEAVRFGARRPPDAHARARASLQARLAAVASQDQSWSGSVSVATRSIGRWSTAAVAIIAVFLVAREYGAPRVRPALPGATVEQDALPIAALTPGATANLTAEQLCRGEAPGPQPADPAVRDRILRGYGMAQVPAHEYELDYLITPELGGATDARNLWPERYGNRTWNAKVKDQLEDLLPILVCEGKVDLRTAQQDIAVDWVAAYKKYFKTEVPLPRRGGTVFDEAPEDIRGQVETWALVEPGQRAQP